MQRYCKKCHFNPLTPPPPQKKRKEISPLIKTNAIFFSFVSEPFSIFITNQVNLEYFNPKMCKTSFLRGYYKDYHKHF